MRMVKRQTKQKYHKVKNVLTIETLLQTQKKIKMYVAVLFPGLLWVNLVLMF
jgi:hypothetical protein